MDLAPQLMVMSRLVVGDGDHRVHEMVMYGGGSGLTSRTVMVQLRLESAAPG